MIYVGPLPLGEGGPPGPDSVGSEEVRDDSLELVDLSPAVRAAIESGGTATVLSLTAATSASYAPATLPCLVRFEGFASATGKRWGGTVLVHVYGSAGSYGVDVTRMEAGTLTGILPNLAPAITVNATTGALTVTFPEAVTGRLRVDAV